MAQKAVCSVGKKKSWRPRNMSTGTNCSGNSAAVQTAMPTEAVQAKQAHSVFRKRAQG